MPRFLVRDVAPTRSAVDRLPGLIQVVCNLLLQFDQLA
jgi:hypothetical protein